MSEPLEWQSRVYGSANILALLIGAISAAACWYFLGTVDNPSWWLKALAPLVALLAAVMGALAGWWLALRCRGVRGFVEGVLNFPWAQAGKSGKHDEDQV